MLDARFKHLKPNFRKPRLGIDLYEVVGTGPEGPPPTILPTRRLCLHEGMVIPFHRHRCKEKIYFYQGQGAVIVYRYDFAGNARHVEMQLPQTIVIPVGWAHAIVCWSVNQPTGCEIVVVSSTFDAKDIEWEPAADELCSA